MSLKSFNLREIVRFIPLSVVLVLGVVPLVALLTAAEIPWLSTEVLAALNLIGWFLVFSFLVWRLELSRSVSEIGKQIGVADERAAFESLLSDVLHELNRRNRSLSINLLERRISSDEELSQALERIVGLAFNLLDGESAELALFDRETGMYHSSFVLGKPFRTSAQAMLSGAVESEEENSSPDVIIQPIAFAGAILGSLRVALKAGRLPTRGDRQIMSLLALQSGLAIINAQYTAQLLKMKHASDETIKAKTGFLANLSHELRGPLGIMINAVELVIDGLCGPVSNDQAETLQMIKNNGAHLLELINDVLDYAKIESGKLNPNKTDILLDELLKDISAVVRKQAEAKGHKLIYKGNNEALAISCDRRHLRQIMINLLTNAIKYTPDNGTIEIWAERIPGNRIKVNVKDSGIGIEPEQQSKVFSAFERIENSYSVTQAGTGLGMSLTHRLVEVNGGSIDFSSAPGMGSHFWVVFSATSATRSLETEKEEQKNHARGQGERILLLQRADGEQKMITRYLNHIGFAVIPASKRTEALHALREKEVSLVLIDNNVIDRPGDDIVSDIRATAKESSLPVILVSSRAFIFDIEKYLRAGIDRCLIKPLELLDLGHICRDLIDGSYTGEVIDKGLLEEAKRTETKDIKLAQPSKLGVKDLMH